MLVQRTRVSEFPATLRAFFLAGCLWCETQELHVLLVTPTRKLHAAGFADNLFSFDICLIAAIGRIIIRNYGRTNSSGYFLRRVVT